MLPASTSSPGAFSDGQAFAGQRTRIDGRSTVDDDAIDWNLLARA